MDETVPPYRIVFLDDEEIVQSLVDRFVVVILDGPKVRFHQRQLFHLKINKVK